MAVIPGAAHLSDLDTIEELDLEPQRFLSTHD